MSGDAFDYEAMLAAIMQRGGVLVRIDRPGVEDRVGEHESERQAFPFDLRIENSGDEEFRTALDEIVVMN